MNVSILYDVVSQIVNQMSLGIRLRRVLRDCVLATLASQSCLLDDLACALKPKGTYEGQYRRIQRFLANERVVIAQLQRDWTQMIVRQMKPSSITLLIDETALSKHLKIMVLGIWTSGGCIPIAWRSYTPTEYPEEGQVKLIANLLDRVLPVTSFPCPITLLADRGIGTSPDLIRAVDKRRIDLLFRVQKTVRFRRIRSGKTISLGKLGLPGYAWHSFGNLFKKAGWLRLYASVAWDNDYDDPWCLVSTQPIDPHLYGRRFDQEVSFRDLKSDGFQWHRSHVWLPSHADRLLLFLAISYWIVLTLGQALPKATRGRQARKSVFRRGIDLLADLFRPTIAPFLTKPPYPPPRFITCVVQ